MAFDQATRNRLSKFVTDTRKLLSDEFSQQMRVKYGLDPATGLVTDIHRLPTMAEGDRQTAQMLRDTLEHYLASSTKRDKKLIAATIDRIVREQAFTVLNRLCAVRMAEARDLVIESIAQGTKSKGFQLYSRLAGSALGETGEAYVSYVFSLFDELSIDLPVLFDRFSPSGRLFPKESVLLEVLEQINHHELQHLWAEDEAIGWVYQYFNSQEERRAMRDESSAPRNSRELAVRNQFFTPRYVVEFLTDNTLGRIWYEMTQGQTRLVDDCKYFVRRSDEVFLSQMTCRDQEHKSDGTIAMAELLLSGTEETFPEFHARDHQPMIELAHCVSAYTTMGDRAQEILSKRTSAVRERSLPEPRDVADAVEAASYVLSGRFESIRTQQILEVLFMTCRNDRHGGDGSVYSEPWFVEACNEVRRRALNSRRDDLSQVELLRQPVFIAYRPMKDPREIKMLDPACGSMHFGLYAFDLFLRIYEEAWELEERLRDQVFVRDRGMKSLQDSYGTREKFIVDVPRLIIERNIHGIDIDSRAVQIAGLSLWLRAQKAWHEAGVKPALRPQITRSNIVCAEPMPGESDLLEQFITDHLSQTSEQQTIASIVRRVFDAMKLAGEAGSLLKIEEEVADTIAEAKRKWVEGPKALQLPLFSIDAKQTDTGPRPLLVAGIDDASFWDEIEERIYDALNDYGEKSGSGIQRRLFAFDAAQGFAFIDLIRKAYDVALMNPPFGECSESSRKYLSEQYEGTYQNVFSSFIERMLSKLSTNGLIGAVTSRTFLFLPDFEYLREKCLLVGKRLLQCVELGENVLDDATVRIAATVVSKSPSTMRANFFRLTEPDNSLKDTALQEELTNLHNGSPSERTVIVDPNLFRSLPGNVFAYTTPDFLLRLFSTFEKLQPSYAWVRRVPGTGENESVLRLRSEVPAKSLAPHGLWCPYAKGGAFSPFYRDCDLVINTANASTICDPTRIDGLSVDSKPRNEDLYGAPALTFSYANDFGIDVRPLRAGSLFDSGGPIVFPCAFEDRWWLLGVLNTRIVRRLVFVLTPERFKQVGMIQNIPVSPQNKSQITSNARIAALAKAKLLSFDETSPVFLRALVFDANSGLADCISATIRELLKNECDLWDSFTAIDTLAFEAYGISLQNQQQVIEDIGPLPPEYRKVTVDAQLDARLLSRGGREIGRGKLTCSYQGTGYLERVSQALHLNSHAASESDNVVMQLAKTNAREFANRFVSWVLGVVFGRWAITSATYSAQDWEADSLFRMLPICPPAQLQTPNGFPVEPADVEASYPLKFNWSGIYAVDPGATWDISTAARQVLAVLWRDLAEAVESEACDILGIESLHEYFANPNGFFAFHLSQYSKSKRQSPIYWPISTVSGSYTIWLYYHRLSDQTLFSIVNEFIDPKIRDLRESVSKLRSLETRSTEDERNFEQWSNLLLEIEELRKELLRIAKFWRPNLNDGVQITAAPLWRLFQLKKWREILKVTWYELEEGKCDWAHLALSIWPDRVVRSAHKDRNIAIAHGLEDVLWHEVQVKKSSKTGRVTMKMEWQPREFSEMELDSIVQRVKSGEFVVASEKKR